MSPSARLPIGLPHAETQCHSSHLLRRWRVPSAGAGDALNPLPAGEVAGASPRARHASGGYYIYNLNAVTSCAIGIKY